MFTLSDKEKKNVERWQKQLQKLFPDPDFRISYTYMFTPTGIGNGTDVKANILDTHTLVSINVIKDFTDYGGW
jgi:hypothetical protein